VERRGSSQEDVNKEISALFEDLEEQGLCTGPEEASYLNLTDRGRRWHRRNGNAIAEL
jgi:hypothetical protein